MKKLAILFLTGIISSGVLAAPVKRSEARQKASAFMSERGWKIASTDGYRPIKSASGNATATADDYQPLYVFNAESSKGFVIISGDDCTETILGYADNASFDENNIPTSLQGWLEGTVQQIEYAAAHNMQSRAETNYNAAIAPLVSSRWGQDAPYNEFCPEVHGEKTPTGCLATAVAQIMYYHKWPTTATTDIGAYTTYTHNITRPKLLSTVFDWDAMHDTYNRNSTNGSEVAKLMQYVGQSLYMDYAPEGSGASEMGLTSTLVNQYHYPNTAKLITRAGQTISKWDEIVYNEIASNRPVLYLGYTPKWEGHAFVCDGYDGAGCYHINWGWDGYYDGYYRLSVLNPNNTTSSGAASTDDGFTEGQKIIAGITTEATANIIQPAIPLYALDYANNNVTWEFSPLTNANYEMALAIIGEDGAIGNVYGKTSKNLMPNRIYTYNVGVGSLPDGTNVYAPVLRKYGTSAWSRIGSEVQYIIITKNGTDVYYERHPNGMLAVSNISFPKQASTLVATRMEFTVACSEEEFDGIIYVFAGSGDEKPANSIGSMTFSAMPGDVIQQSLNVQVPTIDNLHLLFATDAAGNNVVGERVFTSYNISLASSAVTYDPIVVTVNFSNGSENDYNDNIRATVYNAKTRKALGNLDKTVFIPANGEATVVYDTFQLPASATYYITFQYNGSELTKTLSNMSGRVNIDFNPDGIENVTLDGEKPAAAYNLAGQRVADGYKGVVVKKGRKVIK